MSLLGLGLLGVVGVFTGHPAIGIVALGKTADSFFDPVIGSLQRRERAKEIAEIWLTNGLSTVLLVWVGTSLSARVEAAAWGMTAGSGLALCYAWGRNWPCIRGELVVRGTKGVREILRTGLPLGFGALLMAFHSNAGRLAVEAVDGTFELGLYSAATSFLVIGTTIIGAVVQAGMPRVAHLVADGDISAVRRLLLLELVGGLLLGLMGIGVGLAVGEAALRICFGPDFENAFDVLMVVMTTSTFAYFAAVLWMFSLALRLYRVQLPVWVATVVTSCLGCWVCVPAWGGVGAVWATASGFIAQSLLFGLAIRAFFAQIGAPAKAGHPMMGPL